MSNATPTRIKIIFDGSGIITYYFSTQEAFSPIGCAIIDKCLPDDCLTTDWQLDDKCHLTEWMIYCLITDLKFLSLINEQSGKNVRPAFLHT